MQNKVTALESAVTRLITVQEEQTKQTDRIIRTLDNLATLSVTVEHNTRDISDLELKYEELESKVYSFKDKSDINIQNKMIQSISVAVVVVVFAFGYLYADIKTLTKKEESIIISQSEIKKDIEYMHNSVVQLLNKRK